MSDLIDMPGIGAVPDPAGRAQYGGHRGGGKTDRARAIEEASRALVSDKVTVLMFPAGGERRLQVAFQHSDAALLSIAGARTLHSQLGNLLAFVDGRPIKP